MTLKYIVETAQQGFDLNPTLVDSLQNGVLAKAVVGTLLKTDRAHRRTSYIAESWTVSDDKKTWVFQLQRNLKCSDGTEMDAEHFIWSLSRILKLHAAKAQNVSVFTRLKGWQRFLSEKSFHLDGLRGDKPYSVTFEFSHPMDSGFLAFLSIPQFGFYCRNNFDSSGNWKGGSTFVSSGAYTLNSDPSGSTLHLSRRDDWPLSLPGSAKSVELMQIENFSPSAETKHVFVIRSKKNESSVPDGFEKTSGALTWLTSLVVSHKINNLFKNRSNRVYFRKRLQYYLDTSDFPKLSNAFQAKSFYADFPGIDESESPSMYTDVPENKSVLKLVYTSGADSALMSHYLNAIQYALEGSNSILEPELFDSKNENAVTDFLSNEKFAFRLLTSSIGGGPSNWLNDMMFCSSIGVCFPDPDSAMCNLIKTQESLAMDEKEYASRFNEILYHQSSVIPLNHSGAVWVHTSDISAENISPLSPSPLIEQLILK